MYGWRAWEDWRTPKRVSRWLDGRFPAPKRARWSNKVKMAVWGLLAFRYALFPLFLFDRIVASPERLADHGRDAQQMLVFCLAFPLYTRWIVPQDDPLERHEGRVLRAMASRTLANFNGACGIAVLLYAALPRDNVKVLPAVGVTIAIATAAATHKMWARYRRLCTQTHTNIHALVRLLEKPPGEGNGNQSDVLNAWSAVERDLRTRVETGYAFGTRFAPKAVIAALAEAVTTVGGQLPGHQEARDRALTDLQTILDLCIKQIDSVA